MRKIPAILVILLLMAALPAVAQETYFGKNKVQYRNFNWEYIQTEHFDIYFYDSAYVLAKFTAREMEHAYDIISEQLHYYVGRRVPVFIYNSHNDFQQTNIIYNILSEGTQGFTEAFKNRIVLHFMGSFEEYRHLIHHELSHAVIYDLIYGQFFKSILSSRRLFHLPLWFAEGYAEYTSNGGWTMDADMMVRDATINNYLRPPGYMQFLAYTEGFALVKYIVDTYGIDKLGEILKRGKALATMDKSLQSSIGMSSEELYDKFAKEMKKRYWPDISLREEPKEFAKQLTNHEKDGSHYNEKPVFSPDGRSIAIFSDRTGYSEIFLISSINGKRLARLVKGERNANLESLRWYTSGMSFSPDGKNLIFVSKSKGEDAINFLNIKKKDIYRRIKFGKKSIQLPEWLQDKPAVTVTPKPGKEDAAVKILKLKEKIEQPGLEFGLKTIISPEWSPDGKQIVFTALSGAARNLYKYDIDRDELILLTNDRHDDIDVHWHPDGKRIVFSSDRPHPDDYAIVDTSEFLYGAYNLQELDLETGRISPVMVGPGQNTEPVVSPDGEKIAFVSNRNGIENIYVYYIDSARVVAVTNALTNAKSPSWSPESDMIAFTTFYKGGYDIYLLKDLVSKGDNGVLTPTDFVMRKYDNEIEWARQLKKDEFIPASDEDTVYTEDIPLDDPDFPASGTKGRHRWSDLPDREKDEEDDKEKPGLVVLEGDGIASVTPADSSKEATDSTATDTEEKPAEEEDVYVYNAPRDESVFDEMGDLTVEGKDTIYAFAQPIDSLEGDSLDNLLPGGEYRVRPYKTKFTPDIIGGGVNYDSFFGFQGQAVFIFSDYLGDHQILIATDLVSTIDQSNVQFYYFYNKQRIDFRVGLFHTKNFYINASNELFSDRYYGMLGALSWPRSKFTRIELSAATFFIDRKYYDDPLLTDNNVRISTANLSWIHDTVLWGITGPVNGRRYRLSVEGATPVFGTETVDYYAFEFDYRQYLKLGRPFSMAMRFSGGYSDGNSPKTYFVGGSTNKIGSISVGNDIYSIENLYFSSVVTPLRGYDYYDFQGNRYALANMELHFPFVEYFFMRYPLQLGLTHITGALFLDMGAAWYDNEFKGGTTEGGSRLVDIKSGFGFGARVNLGFLLLRYDLAWKTDFRWVYPHTMHYFSLGADF
jgi:Tol biopolymer transport system component